MKLFMRILAVNSHKPCEMMRLQFAITVATRHKEREVAMCVVVAAQQLAVAKKI